MVKKLIDIYPPGETQNPFAGQPLPATNMPEEKRRRFSMKHLWFLLPMLAVPVIVLHFFFAQATIRVWPQVTQLHIEENIIAQVGQESVDLGQKLIPARLFEQEKEATKSFMATGKEERKEKAEGVIRVFNNASTSPQILITNTRFISEDGKLFRSQERISVPGVQNGEAGFFDVRVLAAETGPEYNIDPSNFSLPGLAGSPLYTNIYGKSSTPMAGGAVGEVSVVTAQDIAQAKEQLMAEVKAEASQTLFSRIPPNFFILQGAMETELLADNSLVQEGAVLDEFTYTIGIQVSVLAFAKEHGTLLARHLLESYLEPGEKMKEDTFQVAYEMTNLSKNTGRMTMKCAISVSQYTHVDVSNLQNRFRGASNPKLPDILVEFPTLARAEFSLWPFWIQDIPQYKNRVDIHLAP